MSDEIDIEGVKYISSKRAAQSTGYAQDYIGQLARGGYITARRVGGLWYVSLASVQEHEKNAEMIKAQQSKVEVKPKDKQPEVDSLLSFDGIEYISAARASEYTGYHADYVGQLARAGTVPARQVGNRWYVAREALERHKSEKDALLAAVQSESVGIYRPAPATSEPSAHKEDAPYYTYTSDSGHLHPKISGTGLPIDEEIRSSPVPSVSVEEARPIPIRRSNDKVVREPRSAVRTAGISINYWIFRVMALCLILVGLYMIYVARDVYLLNVPGVQQVGNILERVFSRELIFERT